MGASVILKINGGKLKDQIVLVTPVAEFNWRTPKEVDMGWFSLFLQGAVYNTGHIAFPNIRWMDIELDKSIEVDSDEALAAVSMVQLINALWWVGKEKDIKVEKLSSKGVTFKFTEPNFSVDGCVR